MDLSAGLIGERAQLTGQGSFPAPFQNGASKNEHPDSFSVNRLGSDRLRGLGTADRKEEVNHDLATMGSGRNDDGLLPDDFNRSQIGELTHDQNTNANPDPDGNPCDSRIDHNLGSSDRADDEVKNGMESLDTLANRNPVHSRYFQHMDQVSLSPEIAPSARLSAPANQASFDNVQPDTQKPKKQQRASGSTKTVTERKRNTLTPPTISGCKWKPSGKTGWELYTREASISENGKRSSKGKYLAYYSKEDIRRLNAKRTKKTKLRRDAKSS